MLKRDVTVELYLAKSTFALLKKAYDHVMQVPSINRPLKLKFNDENQKDFFPHSLMICVILKTMNYSFVYDFLNKFTQPHYLK